MGFDELFADVTNEALLEAAKHAVLRMCNGDRRWQMTVPVHWDDSDTSIMEVFRRWQASERRLAEAETCKRLLAGTLSTFGRFSTMHPGDVLAEYEAAARRASHPVEGAAPAEGGE